MIVRGVFKVLEGVGGGGLPRLVRLDEFKVLEGVGGGGSKRLVRMGAFKVLEGVGGITAWSAIFEGERLAPFLSSCRF